jgi:hypothetical protein
MEEALKIETFKNKTFLLKLFKRWLNEELMAG